MLRRVRGLVFALVLFAPVVASAGQGEVDPDGLVSTAPALFDWVDAMAQVLVVYLGI